MREVVHKGLKSLKRQMFMLKLIFSIANIFYMPMFFCLPFFFFSSYEVFHIKLCYHGLFISTLYVHLFTLYQENFINLVYGSIEEMRLNFIV